MESLLFLVFYAYKLGYPAFHVPSASEPGLNLENVMSFWIWLKVIIYVLSDWCEVYFWS